ncbi:hypothetical protein [Oleiharenicola lentus]|uniref:hypothetical protein n=1 Tax=Oleiharenicola lentus TaxID=2508720 RepID=UPI003F6698BC
MKTASNFESPGDSFTAGVRQLIFEMGPWIIVWILVASPFIWLLLRRKKKSRSIASIIVSALLQTALIAAVCVAIHGILAFGEAFGSAIDRDRVRVFVFLTAAFLPTAIFCSARESRNEKNA